VQIDRVCLGLHPTTIAEAFEKAAEKAIEILREISIPIQLSDTTSLEQSATTALNSKVNFKKTSLTNKNKISA
jgi:T-complex protein 1 subunit delta